MLEVRLWYNSVECKAGSPRDLVWKRPQRLGSPRHTECSQTQAHNLAMKMRVVIPDHVLVGFWCCTWGDLPLVLKTKRGHPGSTTRSPPIHNNKAVNIKTTRWEGWADTQTGILPASRKCNVRSKFWWFTEFCNSHYVSHFAAFFIVARTKRSVAKSCFLLI